MSSSPVRRSTARRTEARPRAGALLLLLAALLLAPSAKAEPAGVLARATWPGEPGVAWTVTGAQPDPAGGFGVLRLSRSAGDKKEELTLIAPERQVAAPGNTPARFDETAELRLEDVDGDGRAEALLVAGWHRLVQQILPGDCTPTACFVQTLEQLQVLHVVAATPQGLHERLGLAVAYSSSSSAAEAIDTWPEPEEVRCSWSLLPGTPARLQLRRTQRTVDPHRMAGLYPIAADPLVTGPEVREVTVPNPLSR